ncbi:MAG: ribosome-binding factor A [Patescibacteria group bacterium]
MIHDPNKDKKIEEVIKKAATQFLLVEAGHNSLLTVTYVSVSPKFEHATVFFTAFPDSAEKSALEFAKRKRSEFKEYLRSETKLPRVPFVDFEIDFGEKNRQRIDEISNQ